MASPPRLLALCVALAVCACDGAISDPRGTDGTGGSGGRGPGSLGGGTDEPVGPAFELPRDRLLLLPFDVRMNKLAAVVGAPLDDPMFDALWEKRYELGDHDYARGTAPDLGWSASRMTVWLRALRPVCASEAMRARYPSLRDGLDDFVLAAYGRRATDADLAQYDAAVSGAALDPETERNTMCLAMLSAAEMVAQ